LRRHFKLLKYLIRVVFWDTLQQIESPEEWFNRAKS